MGPFALPHPGIWHLDFCEPELVGASHKQHRLPGGKDGHRVQWTPRHFFHIEHKKIQK